MGDESGGETSPSDADLLQMGCALSEAHVVTARCPSCGSHALAMPDGFRYVVARAFAAGYRLRELGRDGCSEWLALLSSPAIPGAPCLSEAPRRERDVRSDRPCDLGLGEGRHGYASLDGRLWTCPCGSWIVGTRVTFTWPGSPLDGQAHVVADDQLEELGRAGVVGAGEILASGPVGAGAKIGRS